MWFSKTVAPGAEREASVPQGAGREAPPLLRAHKSRIARNHARPGRGWRPHRCARERWRRAGRGRYREKVGGASDGAATRVTAAGKVAGQVRRVARMRVNGRSGAWPPAASAYMLKALPGRRAAPMEDADWRCARASISFKGSRSACHRARAA